MKIYLLLGFLGAGKTTLLKKILSEKKIFSNTAVIINEFGETNIDSQEFSEKEMILKEITGGSIFCACKYDKFVSTIIDLYNTNIDSIVVESSGFSNPTSLHKTIIDLREIGYKLEPIYISVVDAVKFLKLRKTLELIDNQIKYSNVIIVNKIDLVDQDIVKVIDEELIKINSVGLITHAENCEIDVKKVLENCIDHNNSEFMYVLNRNIDFSSLELNFKNSINLDELIDKLKQIANRVYRAKGYINCIGGKYLIEISSDVVTYEKRQIGNGNFVILYSTKEIGKKEIFTIFKDLIVLP